MFTAHRWAVPSKNRLFYFLNYEGRQDASEISVSRIVPGDLFRQGIFTYTRKDNSIGQLSPAQIRNIDPAQIGASPAVLAVLQQYPHPNDTTVGDQLNTFGYRFNALAPLRYNTYIAKVDYQIDSAGKHQIFWRGNLQNDKFTNTSTSSTNPGLQQFPGQAGSQILDNSKGQAVGYSWIIHPSLVNNLRYGYTRQGTETTGVQTSALERFRDIDTLTSTSKGLTQIIPLHQISDDMSWTKGSHTVTGGFVTRFIRNDRLNFGSSFSDVLINSSFLLGSGSDLLAADAQNTTVYKRQMANLLGLLTQRSGNYNYDLQGNVLPQGTGIRRKFIDNEYEMYAQDSWKLSTKLTATYGLRLSLNPPINEGNGYQTSANVSLEVLV
jgi:hypothetical protein